MSAVPLTSTRAGIEPNLTELCQGSFTVLPSTINTIEKQGIVTILESNLQQNQSPPTLRRTISADMSSRKWLSQNGMSPMRRISSYEELTTPSIEVDDDQEEFKQNMPTHDDVWSSILSEKNDNNIETNNQTPPYVHPLLRKSTSNLSQKSLEICTESLGSETGSDGFSSYPPLQTTDDKENEKHEKNEQNLDFFEDFKVSRTTSKKSRPQKKSFPPPLPSIHMQSDRKNGRLVLEAVSVPQQNYFQVDRKEGRLLLTVCNSDPQVPNTPNKLEPEVEEFQELLFDSSEEFDVSEHGVEDEEDNGPEDDQEEGREDEMAIMVEQKSSSLPTSGMMNIPMMKSFLGMGKKESLWSKNMNEVVELMEPEKMVGSLNVYEYFWRNNKTSTINSSILRQQCRWNNQKDYNSDKAVLAKTHGNDQELVIMRGNKRSLLVWQPHCIATS